MPRISVVLPTFNCESFVSSAVESILGQTFGDFELLLLDDGSSDGTYSKLRSYRDPRIRLIRNERNLGLIQNLNKGLKEACGEFIARMDGDDISLPQRFERQLDYLEKNPGVGVLGTSVQIIGAGGGAAGTRDYAASDTVLRWRLLFGNSLAHPSVMFRRSLLERVGNYNPEAVHCEDYELWVRMARFTGLHCLSDQLLQYRIHPGGVSQNKAEAMAEGAAKVAIGARRTLLDWEGRGPEFERADEIMSLCRKFCERAAPTPAEESIIRADCLERIARRERWRAPFWALKGKYVFLMANVLVKMLLTKLSRRA